MSGWQKAACPGALRAQRARGARRAASARVEAGSAMATVRAARCVLALVVALALALGRGAAAAARVSLGKAGATSAAGGVVASQRAAAAGPSYPRPDPMQKASMARWLVHESTWGALATTSVHLNGSAFANILSISDGDTNDATGHIYFYLSAMDPTAGQDLPKDARATLAISEEPLGCKNDAEDPTCGKAMISGRMRELSKGSDEHDAATAALYARHPQMKAWPEGHGFAPWTLDIEQIMLLDFYGGAAFIAAAEYYAAKP